EKIIQSKDNTYIASGYERGVKLGEYKMVFSQINQAGEIIWSKVLDNNSGKKTSSLTFSDGKVADDKNAFFTGWVYIENESEGAKEIPLIKISPSGEILMSKVYGIKDGRVIGYSIDKGIDGGFIISGTIFYTNEIGKQSSDALLIKTNIEGQIEWAKTFDQENFYDLAYSVISTSDNSYLVVGRSADQEGGEEFGARHFFNKEKAFIMKLDKDGSILWQKIFEGNLGQARVTAIKELQDNNFLVIGETYSYPDNLRSQIFITKINSKNGDFIWVKMPEIDNFYQGASVLEDQEGNLIIATSSGRTIGGLGGAFKPVLMKLNKEDGKILWLKIFERPGNGIFFDIDNSFNDNYIITVGKSNSFNKEGYDQAIISQFNEDGILANCQFLKDKKPLEINILDFTPQFETKTLKQKDIDLSERSPNLVLKDFVLDNVVEVCPQ
ncbi:MAG: hypothetical protein PHO28_02995, partial [Candidatus Pacebacteria bacterium]|nr:hypothetical protein [Candidatus Paceibacterota bacterium]